MSKLVIYVVRTDMSHNYRGSGPCINCLEVLKDLRIKRIVYSKQDGTFESVSLLNYNTTHVTHGNRFLKRST